MDRRLFAGFLALTMALYAPVLGGRPFADDWVYVLDRPAQMLLGAWGNLHPYQFYRPLPLALVALLQILGRGSPVPLHALQFCLHALLALAVVSIAVRRGIPHGGAVVAGLFLVASQSAAAAVGGFDTLSLTLSTLLGTVALGLLLPPRRPGPAAAAFAISLLCKESALGYLPLLLLLSLAPAWGGGTPADRRRRPAVAVLLLAIAGGYLVWRAHLGAFGPSAGTSSYNMQLGGGLLRNLAMLWFAALLPLSSVDVFTAAAMGQRGFLLLGVCGALCVLVLSMAGFFVGRRPGRAAALLLAGSTALLPVLPLNHVSELYAYTLLPFAALLFGESVSTLAAGSGRAPRLGLIALTALLLGTNAVAAGTKSAAMAENGRQAERVLGGVAREMRELPQGGSLVLEDPVLQRPNYSVFRLRSFLLVPDETLVRRSGRSDVRLIRVPAGSDSSSIAGADRVLTLDAEARPVPL